MHIPKKEYSISKLRVSRLEKNLKKEKHEIILSNNTEEKKSITYQCP